MQIAAFGTIFVLSASQTVWFGTTLEGIPNRLRVVDGRANSREGKHELRAAAVVGMLRRRGPTGRLALARDLGISPNTLDNTVGFLRDGGVVYSGFERDGHDRLWLHPDLGIIVGVTLSHRHANVAISRFDLEPINDVAGSRCEIQIEDPEASIRQIAELIVTQLGTHVEEEVAGEKLVGIGVSVPGPIAREPNHAGSSKEAAEWNRTVQSGFILPGWDEIDLGARLASLLIESHGLRPPRYEERRVVWVENDASAGALGVHTEMRNNLALGGYEGHHLSLDEESVADLVYVHITSGIGAGIVNKGHLVTGARGFAGELGHVVVVPRGDLCALCGGRGCLETVASNRAVMEQLGGLFPEPPIQSAEPDDATAAATASKDRAADLQRHLRRILALDHPAVDRALRGAGWHVGTVMATVCGLLNPATMVFGGEMPERVGSVPAPGRATGKADNRPFLAAVSEAIDERALPQVSGRLEIATWNEVRNPEQTLSPEMLGALALVIDHLGDAYLLKPVSRWIRTPSSREVPISFSEPCDAS